MCPKCPRNFGFFSDFTIQCRAVVDTTLPLPDTYQSATATQTICQIGAGKVVTADYAFRI
ncbi:hypothetical protein PSP6_390094 [Paraburkholderia tropica]|nr:hypothetical protein PSP6_390094 [Paraburkholderia tropica]